MSGTLVDADPAQAALDLVGSDPGRALALADSLVATAPDRAAAAAAERAAGLALRELGELAAAEQRLRRAVALARRAGSPSRESEASLSLALLLLDRGRVRAALAAAERAAAAVDGLAGARVGAQRALVLQRAGRHEEALEAYRVALPVLRRHRDRLWEARALNNRALLQAYAGSLGPARADLERARSLHADLGRTAYVADCDWNLGFLAGREGDVPAALAAFDRAEEAYARSGSVHPQLLLDRAEVLLAAGLHGEAHLIAERAVQRMREAGAGASYAEGLLLLAQAGLEAGRPGEAARAAREAARAFLRQDRPGWALLSRTVALRADAENGSGARGLLDSALALAADLSAAGWPASELDARLTAASAATRLGLGDVARAELRAAASARRSGSLALRVRAWLAEARLRESDGDRAAAAHAVRRGLDTVRARQATLVATDLRVHGARHGERLAELGISLALAGGRATSVLAAAERGRAQSLLVRPARPPANPAHAAALAELRRLSTESVLATLADQPAAALDAARRRAERAVVAAARVSTAPRAARRRVGSAEPGSRSGTGDLARALGPDVLVELVRSGALLHAVTLVDGRARLHALGPAADLTDAVERLGFAVRRAAHGSGGAAPDGQQPWDAPARRLDDLLLRPLHLPPGRDVVVVPTGALHAVAWPALPSLTGRALTVAPSAAVWLRSRERAAGAVTGGTVVAVAGPGLPGAAREVESLARLAPGVRTLAGEDATVERVLRAADGADVLHVASHGDLREDNPQFSGLVLADGTLTVYDLERLARPPRLVVLPACGSGATAVASGEEVMGLVASLLGLGVGTVVAPVGPVHDGATGTLMVELHRALLAGAPPAAALAALRARGGTGDLGTRAALASLTAFGGWGGATVTP